MIAEKPTLILDENDTFAVLVPDLNFDSSGVQWGLGTTLFLDMFYIATPEDSAETINAALLEGKNILFTPGVYMLSDQLTVSHANTVLLGIGLPSLLPINGTPAIAVADVDGVRIAGLMLDAGPVQSPTLLEIGEPGSSQSHAANPTILYDIFCRVGGLSHEVTKTIACLTIHSHDVVCDNLWLWRADHGVNDQAVGWTLNTADHGIIVNGDHATIYGLAVKHFQKTQTLWNGEDGRVYFYQCELPYDVPAQGDWKDRAVDGYAAYKIADHVKTHVAWGFGVYSYFRDASNVYLENAITSPNQPGISLNHMVCVWLNGNKNGSNSGIRHIVNGQGLPAISNVRQSTRISTLENNLLSEQAD